jgi:hypothetical protein
LAFLSSMAVEWSKSKNETILGLLGLMLIIVFPIGLAIYIFSPICQTE